MPFSYLRLKVGVKGVGSGRWVISPCNTCSKQNVHISEWHSIQLLFTFTSNNLHFFKNVCTFHTVQPQQMKIQCLKKNYQQKCIILRHCSPAQSGTCLTRESRVTWEARKRGRVSSAPWRTQEEVLDGLCGLVLHPSFIIASLGHQRHWINLTCLNGIRRLKEWVRKGTKSKHDDIPTV